MITINQHLAIGEAAELLGVSVPILRRWEVKGKIKSAYRTVGTHRRFSFSEVKRLLGQPTE